MQRQQLTPPEIILIKGKLEDVELPVKHVDIIISEASRFGDERNGLRS
jgi:hypothetical protein